MPIAICKKVYRKNELGKNNNDRISGYLETCLPRENRSSFWVVSGPSSPLQTWFFFLGNQQVGLPVLFGVIQDVRFFMESFTKRNNYFSKNLSSPRGRIVCLNC